MVKTRSQQAQVFVIAQRVKPDAVLRSFENVQGSSLVNDNILKELKIVSSLSKSPDAFLMEGSPPRSTLQK
jgi:hypothetical protein